MEEDDRLVEYFSEGCVFLEMLDSVWQSQGHGVARLLRGSRRVVIFQFWVGETTSSSLLVVLDSCFDLVEAGVLGRGRTPSTRVDLPSTAMRCALRRRSWLVGSTTGGRLRGEHPLTPFWVPLWSWTLFLGPSFLALRWLVCWL